LEPLPLPHSVVGELNGQIGERRRRFPLALPERPTERGQFLHKQTQRPGVNNNVVDDEKQQMIVRAQSHHPGSQQRPDSQIERTLPFVVGELARRCFPIGDRLPG
jgi:pyruvate carboxylase